MKQIVLTAPYTFEISDVPVPEPADNQVLVKIRQFGICGSDIQMYRGLHKYMTYPVIIGHEVAAVVEKVGKDVVGFSKGDNVTVEPQIFCDECYPCKSGRFNVCENLKVLGVHLDGLAREYAVLETFCLHPCDGLDTDETALIEPLAVGVGCVKRAGDISGQNVVVVGAGTIGNLVAQSAKAMGAADVMITDINQKKLDYAKECGINHCVNTAERPLKECIEEAFGMRKADVIIDCAATRGSILSILEAARPSSKIIVTGNFKYPIEIEMPVLQRQEISLIGHMMYVFEDFSDAIRLVQEKKVKLQGFATQRYGIDELDEAFKFIEENPDDVMKVMISI
ncbi:MAG: zinc-dependent alcohol dehydrogenase [Christensenellales bacterium]|jgi:L-iditol 2-dehydrogenase